MELKRPGKLPTSNNAIEECAIQTLDKNFNSLQQAKDRHCSCGCEDLSFGDTSCNSQENDCFLSC